VNSDEPYLLSLPDGAEPERLDVFLFRHLEEIPSRNFASRLIEKGFVEIAGKKTKPSFKVEAHHVVKVDPSFWVNAQCSLEPLPQNIPLQILFEDNDILVIHKPAGLVVHPGAGVSEGTLVNAVLAHCGCTLPTLGGPERAGIVHRLDRDTSGVMVVAKSQKALTSLSAQFAQHSQLRRYLAIAFDNNEQRAPEGDIETFHGRDTRHRTRYAVVAEDQGKKAKLHYKILASSTHPKGFGGHRLVQCTLHTGRTHQIRVQLTYVGMPLVGDGIYGFPRGRGTEDKEHMARLRRLATRQMLHAQVLGITHPTFGTPLVFEAEPPADFKEVTEFLKFK
jgi:23S rRNA pseudouridine1911/1915/1917 synthase